MRRFVQAFFRHPILLILPVIVSLVVSVGYATSRPRVYRAGLSLWCDTPVPAPSSIFAGDEQPAAAQLAVLNELLQTKTFLTRVGQAGPWAPYLASHSQADDTALLYGLATHIGASTAGRHVLSLSTTGASPNEALDLAKALGTAYVAQINETQQSRAKSSVGFYQLQVDETSKALADAQNKLDRYLLSHQSPTAGPLGPQADAEASQITQQVSAAQSNYDQAKANAATAGLGLSSVSDSGVLRIFDKPTASPNPVSRKKKVIFAGVAGVFAGVTVSFVTLLLLVLGDQSVHGAGDVEGLLGMQVVGTIEQFRSKRRRGTKVS